MNRTHKKLSPCHYRALYTIYKNFWWDILYTFKSNDL
jgi:hypothetical protein